MAIASLLDLFLVRIVIYHSVLILYSWGSPYVSLGSNSFKKKWLDRWKIQQLQKSLAWQAVPQLWWVTYISGWSESSCYTNQMHLSYYYFTQVSLVNTLIFKLHGAIPIGNLNNGCQTTIYWLWDYVDLWSKVSHVTSLFAYIPVYKHLYGCLFWRKQLLGASLFHWWPWGKQMIPVAGGHN